MNSTINSNNNNNNEYDIHTMTLNKHKNKKQKKKRKNENNFEQTFLDLGQKNFDLKTCKLCGMMYAPGKIEDEKIHRKVCKSIIKSNNKKNT